VTVGHDESKRIFTRIFVIVLALVVPAAVVLVAVTRVNPSFATCAHLIGHYTEKPVNTTVTDVDDVRAVKEILTGWAVRDSPACGFTGDISITLTDGRKRITFYPAFDGCHTFRIGETDRYMDVSEERWKDLNSILRKYGMVLP
jgi:hypothetical protein